jgi:hypothetical protein
MPPCLPARFQRLARHQQRYLADRLQTLEAAKRRDVLDEWDARCAMGQVKSAFAYLCGLIKRAVEGTFLLWAARRKLAPRRTPANVPAEARSSPAAIKATFPPADPPASREVASAHLQHMKALLQGAVNTAPVIHTTKPPERRKHPQAPLVRAMARAVSPAGPLRPLAAFLTPIMGTGQ